MDRVDFPTIYNIYNMRREKKKMADNAMFNVKDTFDMEVFATRLADAYKAKGFAVNIVNISGAYAINFDKGTGGINNLLGLGQGIRATITNMNGAVTISFSDGDWLGKIIGLSVGWFLCLIPFITAIIGTVRQLSLPKSIANDAMQIAASL